MKKIITILFAFLLLACSSNKDLVQNYNDDGIYYNPGYVAPNVGEVNYDTQDDYYDPDFRESSKSSDIIVVNNFNTWGYHWSMNPWMRPWGFYDPFYNPWAPRFGWHFGYWGNPWFRHNHFIYTYNTGFTHGSTLNRPIRPVISNQNYNRTVRSSSIRSSNRVNSSSRASLGSNRGVTSSIRNNTNRSNYSRSIRQNIDNRREASQSRSFVRPQTQNRTIQRSSNPVRRNVSSPRPQRTMPSRVVTPQRTAPVRSRPVRTSSPMRRR